MIDSLSSRIREGIDVFRKIETELPKILVIYGPTACGKTGLSLDIAEYLETEIISADSRQIYRGLDIGTGKIGREEMRDIPHHMLDVIEPTRVFSMVDFAQMALPLIEKIQRSGKIPILCGGTGLYIDAILYAMDYPDTPPDWEYRNTLEDIRREKGDMALWNMLHEVDPEYAEELLPENYRYVMRGLEVIKATGKSKRESKNTKKPRFFPLFITPYSDSPGNREVLYSHINTRVVGMFDSGLVEEVRYNIDIFGDCPGLGTIGYKEVSAYLRNEYSLEAAVSLVQQHSRNYAKRQITWNKRYLSSLGIHLSLNSPE